VLGRFFVSLKKGCIGSSLGGTDALLRVVTSV